MTKVLSAVVEMAVVTVIVSLPTVAAAQFAAPVSPGYIPDTEVEAALAEGDILLQDRIPVASMDTAESIAKKVQLLEHQLLVSAIQNIALESNKCLSNQ